MSLGLFDPTPKLRTQVPLDSCYAGCSELSLRPAQGLSQFLYGYLCLLDLSILLTRQIPGTTNGQRVSLHTVLRIT